MKDIKITIDLTWMDALYPTDENDIDSMIESQIKIDNILRSDMQISSLIRKLKRNLHTRILTTDITDTSSVNKLYKLILTTSEQINSLMYYSMLADSPEDLIEEPRLVYNKTFSFTEMMNMMPDPDLRSKLWCDVVCSSDGIVNLAAVYDEIATYIEDVKEIQQNNIYDLLYILRYKGIEHISVEEGLKNLVTIANKIMLFEPFLIVTASMKEEIEKQQAEARASKVAKSTTRKRKKKEDTDNLN